jgi:hypothetical protein
MQWPAVRGKHFCRIHGAGGGAPSDRAHGGYSHGLRTQSSDAARLLVRELLKSSCSTLGLLCE